MAQNKEQICRLCTCEVSDAIDLFSTERRVADRMATILELPLEKDDGLTSYVCQLCNARFNQLVRSLDVYRLKAKKSHEKLAKRAGIFVDESKLAHRSAIQALILCISHFDHARVVEARL